MTKFAKVRRSDRKVMEVGDEEFEISAKEKNEFENMPVEDGTRVGDIRRGSTAEQPQQGQQGQQGSNQSAKGRGAA